jgi:hypothetical protein
MPGLLRGESNGEPRSVPSGGKDDILLDWGESVEARLSEPIPVVTASDFGDGCMASESLRRWASESSERPPADEDEATVRFPKTGEGLLAPTSDTDGLRADLTIGDVIGVAPAVSPACVVEEVASVPVS